MTWQKDYVKLMDMILYINSKNNFKKINNKLWGASQLDTGLVKLKSNQFRKIQAIDPWRTYGHLGLATSGQETDCA